MEKNPSSNFLKSSDLYAFLVGLAIASLHFVFVSFVSPLSGQFPGHNYSPLSIRDLIQVALIAPGTIPIGVVSFLTSSFASEDLIYAFSSFFYGITSGFLVTKRKALRRIGTILVGLWLLLNCFVWFMFTL